MIQDNTAKWCKKKLTNFASNEALPVGHIYQSLSKNVPLGSLPLLGGEYDRTLYADLWSWANENGLVVSEAKWQDQALAQGGSCSNFSEGNGSTTFRVPALKCWIKGANGVEEVGSYLEDGLPNIVGVFGTTFNHTNINGGENIQASGAFRNTVLQTGVGPTTNNYWSTERVDFDASRSNSIYGNSDTVQPQSIVGIWLIVAYGTVTNVGNADVGNVMQAVEQVQTGLGKVDGITDYIVESYRNGDDWYRVWKSGWVEQGGISPYAQNDKPLTLLKPFASERYFVTMNPASTYTGSLAGINMSVYNQTSTTITMAGADSVIISWYACGQGA